MLARKLIEFRRHLRHLELDPEGLRQLRERKLRALVHHVYRNVSYYRSLFDQAGIDPATIRTLDDLPRIPITSKSDLRRAGRARIMARGIDPESCVRFDTTGSTGRPFAVYVNGLEKRTRLLIELRGLWANDLLRPRDRLVFLGPDHWDTQPLYTRLGFFSRHYVSPWLPIQVQIERLRALRPDVLWAYPTALRAVLECVDGRLSPVCRPRALVTSAEVVSDELRERILSEGIECFNFYATMETGRIAWECRSHAGLHLNADRVVYELVDEGGGSPTPIVTALDGLAMPFLRYRLDDVCAWVGRPCPCGIRFPLLQAPAGRVAELVRLSDGRTFPSWMFDQVLRPFGEIDRFQVRQDDLARIAVHIVPRETVENLPLDAMKAGLRRLLGDSVELDFAVVDDLLPGPRNGIFVSTL
jgi:phenylacetate-CoA ligase